MTYDVHPVADLSPNWSTSTRREERHKKATRIVATVQSSVTSIITGIEHGETDLIDKDALLEDRL